VPAADPALLSEQLATLRRENAALRSYTLDGCDSRHQRSLRCDAASTTHGKDRQANVSAFDWRACLARWSTEWLQDAQYRAQAPPGVIATGWLGYAGATEAQLAAAERRLGIALPPSYRAFLHVSNGWRRTSPFIYHLWSTGELEWLSVRNQHLIDIWTAADMPDCWEQRAFPGALEVSDWGDAAIYLLNPRAIRPDGEWEAGFFPTWGPFAQVYGSFQELMEAEYDSFRRLRGDRRA
jgi:hypothetical protein